MDKSTPVNQAHSINILGLVFIEYEEARPYYALAAKDADSRSKEAGEAGVERVRKAIEWRKSQKPQS